MSLKSIIWTAAIAVIVFFITVSLGIKYNWVQSAEPKLHTSATVEKTDTIGSVSLEKANSFALDKSIKAPELIDEPLEANTHSTYLGSTDLSIEDIVSRCQALTQSVGIPEAKVEQAMMECINRNSTHLVNNEFTADKNEKLNLLQEQCDSAITQRDLLSPEEVKMLLDECVASKQ